MRTRWVTVASIVGVAMGVGVGRVGAAPLQGPVFPAPGGTTFTPSGSPSAGDPGGRNFAFSGIAASSFARLYWGPQPSGVKLSLSGPSNLMTLLFDAGRSNLPGGVAMFTGSGWPYASPAPGSAGGPLNVRFTLRQTSPAAAALLAAPAELSDVGVALDAKASGGAFTVNLLFEAEYPPGSGTWVPVNTLQYPAGNQAQTSFAGGFYFEPLPANVPATRGPAAAALALAAAGALALRARRRGRPA